MFLKVTALFQLSLCPEEIFSPTMNLNAVRQTTFSVIPEKLPESVCFAAISLYLHFVFFSYQMFEHRHLDIYIREGVLKGEPELKILIFLQVP